ncbi:putative allantoate permease [Phaeomoniella chlamydospora]|uniref:Putative allantoate permease n=1 Tax=Phaeomoniella chlamydospora TaxID=158046 RepID=A0A0G2E4P0_PHACM|nr:putative allantoate permease [Phaeomoniella chlamydospora]
MADIEKSDRIGSNVPTDIDNEPAKAIQLLRETAVEGTQVHETDHIRLRWKIDMTLMPLLCITYALQSIDKTTLGYAAVFGLSDDTHLVGTQYSWASALFYLGYLVWEYPTNLLLQRLPINLFMAGTVMIWGAILMCSGSVEDFSGLAALRFFLGMFEASINPGTMLIFSMYYKRSEQPLRMGIWIGSAGLGYVISGIASYGIGHIHSSLASWRLLFIIWGAITTAWGCILLFTLPGSPLTTKFLKEHERVLVVDRIKENGTGVENKHFKKDQFFEAMLDIKTWLLFLFAVTSNSPNGGLTSFQSLIIKGLGFSTLQTTLIQMPSGGIQLIACPIACFFASRYRNARLAIMLICLIPFLAGVIGLWTVPESRPYGRLVCLWISFTYTATWTLSMSVATANTAGHTKKITTNAFLLIGYCLGNFIGPFFFKASQSPTYDLGVGMMFFCIGIQVICLISLWVLFWYRNKKRRQETSGKTEDDEKFYEASFADSTDLQNRQFRYVY